MMHYAGIGFMCSGWEEGHKDTIDWNHVDCADCKEHLDSDPENGVHGWEDGRECPSCGDRLKPIDDGDSTKCPCCGVEFMCVTFRVVFPMSVSPEDFAKVVAEYIKRSPSAARSLAIALDVAESTVKRWATGVARPHPKVQNLAMSRIGELVRPKEGA